MSEAQQETLENAEVDKQESAQPAENTDNSDDKVKETEEQPADQDEEAADADKTEDEDGESVEEGEVESPPTKKTGRAQERIRRQQEELKEERERNEKLARENAETKARLESIEAESRQRREIEEQRAEQERLDLLAPEERALYLLNKRLQQTEARLAAADMQRQDDIDRLAFQQKVEKDPTYAKFSKQVEDARKDGLARGVVASREDLHSFFLGQELKKDMERKANSKKEQASRRVDSATARPASAKSDVAGKTKGKTLEQKLEGVIL